METPAGSSSMQRTVNKVKMSKRFPLDGEKHPGRFLLPDAAFTSQQLFATKWEWLLA